MTRLNKTAFYLIPALCILTTLAYGTVHQPLIAIFYLLVGLSAFVWAVDSYNNGAIKVSMEPLQLPLLLLGAYAVVQLIPFGSVEGPGGVMIPRTISLEPFGTQLTAIHIFFLSVFFALALISLDSARRLRRVAVIFAVFGFAYAFYAILQSVLSPTKIYGIYGPQGAVPFGSFVNKHNFAAVMELLICLPLGLLFTNAVKPDRRLLYAVAVVLMASSVLLSGSRGGLVALIVEVILLVILTTRAKGAKNILLKAGLSALLIAAAVGGAVFVGGDTSLTRFADSASTTDITSSRTHIWGVTLRVITANLPFGAGLGAYVAAYPKFDTASGLERVEQSHNDYLQIVADAGLVGLVIGLAFLFLFVKKGKQAMNKKNTFQRGIAVGAFAGCAAVLTHSLFDFVLHITAVTVMFLTVLAVLAASGRSYDDEITEFDEGGSRRRKSGSVRSFGSRSSASNSSQA